MTETLHELLASIVHRELRKISQMSGMDHLLAPEHMESLAAISKILKATPELAEAEASIVAPAVNLDDALKLLGAKPEGEK